MLACAALICRGISSELRTSVLAVVVTRMELYMFTRSVQKNFIAYEGQILLINQTPCTNLPITVFTNSEEGNRKNLGKLGGNDSKNADLKDRNQLLLVIVKYGHPKSSTKYQHFILVEIIFCRYPHKLNPKKFLYKFLRFVN